MALRGHTHDMFYPVDVPKMVRAATLGARADDPILPFEPSRRQRIAARLRRIAPQREQRHGRRQRVTTASRCA
jgi:hypothetical protein